MAEDINLLKERMKILQQLNELAEKGATKTSSAYKTQIEKLKEVNVELDKIKKAQSKNSKIAKDLESLSGNLSGVYRNQQTEIKKQATIFYQISGSIKTALARGGELSDENKDQAKIVSGMLAKYKEQSDIAREISQLSADDVIQKNELQNQFDRISEDLKIQEKEINAMTRIGQDFLDIQREIEYSIGEQRKNATDISSLTSEQKAILEDQSEIFESIKKKVNSIGSTLTTFLRRPQAAIGALVIGAGALVNKFADVNKELGNGFDILNSTTASAGLLGFVFEDTAGTVKALASEFGDVSAATFKTQANVGSIAANMGISNTEAVGLVGSFARLNGNSTDIAADMIKTTQQFAKQNGIIPTALMADLANSAEQFALFGKDGGENILKAAGYAAKLGTNMNTISGIAESLLDFESSITKELELGAMLGKTINLDRARALAFEGDIEGATKETLKALGGIEEFNKMDYFQKKATADLLGTSVAELQKMTENQEKANDLGGVMNSRFSAVGETIEAGLNKYLGTGLQGLGGMITMTGELGDGFGALGIDMGGMVKSSAQILKNLLGMVAGPVLNGIKTVGGALANTGVGKGLTNIKDKLMAGVGDTTKSIKTPDMDMGGSSKFMESISKIKMNDVIKGAAAMVIVAGAVFVFGKAVQEFMKVSWEAVGMAVVSMLSLVGAVTLLGAIMSSGVGAVAILAGAAAMLVIAASVLVLGIALQQIGTGFEMMSAGIQSLVPNLTSVATAIGQMIIFIPAIAALSLAMLGLAGALTAVGIAGVAALPGLMAVAAVGAIAVGVGSLLGFGGDDGGSSSGDNKLLEEIRGLRADLSDGKVGVYMDGQKVTAAISKVVNKVGSNSYAI